MAKKTDNTPAILLGISALLGLYFLYHTLQLVQNLKQHQIVGSPASYAGIPAALLAIFVLAKSKEDNNRVVAVVILSVLVTCMLVWLFGVTGAGSSLSQY